MKRLHWLTVFAIILFVLFEWFVFVSASNVGLIENSIWQSNLTTVVYSAVALGDIDNDGDLDLVLTGCSAGLCTTKEAKIYTNNGTSLVENSTWQQNLTGVFYSSVVFGDVDNDGDLDLAIAGCSVGGSLSSCTTYEATKIYINNGTTLIEDSTWQSNITATAVGSIEFGDIDNDGDLDLVVVGNSAGGKIAKIYLNNGSTLTENQQWQSNLSGVYESDIAFGDVDNDGDLDLALTGDKAVADKITAIYINNGTSLVEDSTWSQNLKAVDRSSLIFGDIDNDGDLDLNLIGQFSGDWNIIYRNNGTVLVENQTDISGYFRGSIAFGDYDNDGDLDLVATGKEPGRARVFENNQSNTYNFVIDSIAGANISANTYIGSLVWGDLNNDFNLDLIVTGSDIINALAKIYISNISLTKNNTQPNASTSGFSATYSNNQLTLSWGNGSDTETNTSGLYYNLMVGNSTTNHTIVSGVYGGSGGGSGGGGGASGYFGNMMQRKSITLNIELDANETYNWYVQTIDTGLAKSNWSAVQSFTTASDTTKPEITINSPSTDLYTINPVFDFNVSVTDADVSNVTLYADWTGSMIENETNSSGFNGDYIFTKNLTGYDDGQYNWYIEANDSSNNSQTSATRNFYLDRGYPLVYLEGPADGNTWSSSSTVTFSYNVSDIDIANCSLIIDDVVDQTDDTISEDESQSFTKSMSNADYTWYVNCSDYVGYTNGSLSRALTVSYSSGDGGGPGGGGSSSGSSGTPVIIEPAEKEFDVDFSTSTKASFSVSQGDIKTFSLNSETKHTMTVLSLTTDSMTLLITSEPITIQIKVNEIKQIDMNNDGINDLEFKLVSIINGKANFEIVKLSGAVIAGQEELEEAVLKEALFDVKVSVLDKFREVFAGEEVSAEIEVLNVNNIGQVDVVVDYYLSDNETVYGSGGSDTLAVEAVASFVRSLLVPEDMSAGIYYFNVNVTYKDFVTSGSGEFRVKGELSFLEDGFKLAMVIVIGIIGVMIIIGFLFFVLLRRIKKRGEKIEKKEMRLERIVKKLKPKKIKMGKGKS